MCFIVQFASDIAMLELSEDNINDVHLNEMMSFVYYYDNNSHILDVFKN